jgi:hypothetical protein
MCCEDDDDDDVLNSAAPLPQDFLNGVCTNIMRMHKKQLWYYSGNYDTYMQTREVHSSCACLTWVFDCGVVPPAPAADSYGRLRIGSCRCS